VEVEIETEAAIDAKVGIRAKGGTTIEVEACRGTRNHLVRRQHNLLKYSNASF